MISTAGWMCARAATVSLRYATVRRQGGSSPSSPSLENQIITYPSLYTRLLPILSHSYIFILLGRHLVSSFSLLLSQLSTGDASLLAETHSLLSGLKVLVSTTSVVDLEIARRSMGGHGYSTFSGLGKVYADHLPSATYEGDNFVLDGQVVRAALKGARMIDNVKGTTYDSAEIEKHLTPSSWYLRFLLPNRSLEIPRGSEDWRDWLDFERCAVLLEWRAALMVRERLHQEGEGSSGGGNARLAKAACEAFVGRKVVEMAMGLDSDSGGGGTIKDGKTKEVVRDLFLLVGVPLSIFLQ